MRADIPRPPEPPLYLAIRGRESQADAWRAGWRAGYAAALANVRTGEDEQVDPWQS